MKCRKRSSISFALVGIALVVLLGAVGLVSAQEATETPFATRTMVGIPTSTPVTPAATYTPTPLLPPWLPYWPGSTWKAVPTSTEQPGCPDWTAADVDVSVLDYRWRSACAHCLPGAVINPLVTRSPWERTPTLGPVAAWSLLNTLDVTVEREAGDPAYVNQVEVFPAESMDVVGVVFSAWHSGGGSCDLRILGGRLGSPVASDGWLGGGQYCFGPDDACRAVAPGSIHPSSDYRLVPKGNQLVLELRLGQYPGDCGADSWQLTGVKWIGVVRPDPTATPTGTPGAPASKYALTCPIQWASEAVSGDEYITTLEYSGAGGLGLPWPYPEHAVVYGVLFSYRDLGDDHTVFPVGNQGECGLSLFANAGEDAPALTGNTLYCAGSKEACDEAAGGEQYRWFDLPENGLDLVNAPACFEMGLEIYPGGAGWETVLDAAFIVDAPGPDCDVALEPTPTPTATPSLTRWMKFSGAVWVGSSSNGTVSWTCEEWVCYGSWMNVPGGNYISGPQFKLYLDKSHATGYTSLTLAWYGMPRAGGLNYDNWTNDCSTSAPYRSAYRIDDETTAGDPPATNGRWVGEEWVVDYVMSTGFNPKSVYDNGIRQCPSNSAPAGKNYPNMRVRIVAVSGVTMPNPLQMTPTPTPAASPTPRATLTPTPVLDGNLCEYAAVRDGGSLFGDGELFALQWDVNYEEQTCYTVIPRVGYDLPDKLGGHYLGWPAFRACVVWVQFPSFNLFGVRFQLDLLLIPVFVYVLDFIRKL